MDKFDGWSYYWEAAMQNLSISVGMAEIARLEQGKRVNMLKQFREMPGKMTEIIPLVQKRIKTFSDIFEEADFFFDSNFNYDSAAVDKRLKKDYVPLLLKKARKRIEQLSPFNEETLESMARNLSKDFSLTTGEVFHPLRVSLTGKMKGPGLFELAVALGNKEVLRRIDRTLGMLENA